MKPLPKPLSIWPSCARNSHETIVLQVSDLTVLEFGLLQDLVEAEIPDVDVRVEGLSDAFVAVLSGFRYQVCWAGYLLGVELGRRVRLDELFAMPDVTSASECSPASCAGPS